MAVYPCDWHSHRYPDPQRSAYVTYACGELLQTNALRLCPRDFEKCLEVCRDELALIDDDSQVSRSCERCGKDKNCAIFVKIFELKGDPAQYAADFCGACAEEVLAHLQFANGRHVSTR